MKNIKIIAVCVLFAWTNSAFPQHTGHQHSVATESATTSTKASPYAGAQLRDIKSLSSTDVVSLQNGAGMAYAKAAELNGYPGPSHVLELAAALQLTSDQRSATEKLILEHKAKARELGGQLISAERALDSAFALKQVARYQTLCGYDGTGADKLHQHAH